MMISLSDAARRLKAADDILVLSHQFPDGDTLGSASALCHALTKIGKRVGFACSDPIGEKFQNLFCGLVFTEFKPKFIVSVDIADTQLLGDGISKYAEKVDLCIDHHGSNSNYAKETYVDSDASATCEIIYELLPLLGTELDQQAALCIYTGIVTDTGCFKYSNVTPRTFLIASQLLECGIDAAEVNRVMFDTKSIARLEMERFVIESIEFFYEGRCAIAEITQEMMMKANANDDEIEGLAALPRQVEGVIIGVSIREKKDGTYKVSLRATPPVDASAICHVFGGGGHKGAAGCSFNEPIEQVKKKMVQAIGDYLTSMSQNS